MKRTQVTIPSCPGSVSETPEPFSLYQNEVNEMETQVLRTNNCTLAFHMAMRLDEPNATTEAAEISAAWGCLLVEADMYAILTVVVPTMKTVTWLFIDTSST